MMFDRLMSLLSSGGGGGEANRRANRGTEQLQLAAAALMVQAACLDGHFDAGERKTIHGLLENRFHLTTTEAEALIDEATTAASESVQLFGFTQAINNMLAPEERIQIIEMLWEVAYADGEVHYYESNLVRRVAGLLYVSDRDSGLARNRVSQRRNTEDPSES